MCGQHLRVVFSVLAVLRDGGGVGVPARGMTHPYPFSTTGAQEAELLK